MAMNKRDFFHLKMVDDLISKMRKYFDFDQAMSSPKTKKSNFNGSRQFSKASSHNLIEIDENTRFMPSLEKSNMGTSSSRMNDPIHEINIDSNTVTVTDSIMNGSKWGNTFNFTGTNSSSIVNTAALDPKDVRVATSGITHDLKMDVNTFRMKFSIKNIHTSSSMTHLVTLGQYDSEKNKIAPRTFKVMYCIVNSIPVVDYRWIRECMLSGKIVDPQPYRIMRDKISNKGMIRSVESVGMYDQ